jgi:hypothetical protein
VVRQEIRAAIAPLLHAGVHPHGREECTHLRSDGSAPSHTELGGLLEAEGVQIGRIANTGYYAHRPLTANHSGISACRYSRRG